MSEIFTKRKIRHENDNLVHNMLHLVTEISFYSTFARRNQPQNLECSEDPSSPRDLILTALASFSIKANLFGITCGKSSFYFTFKISATKVKNKTHFRLRCANFNFK